MKQTPAHHDFNLDVFDLLPNDRRHVVEVGCSFGGLAKAYREVNPGCRYTGIEIDPDYAEVAAGSCTDVLSADFEMMDDERFGTLAGADCWIFSDVLEHFKDPWSALRRIRAVLPPGGCVVASLPNTQHWSFQILLSNGFLRYQDSGLFDRTHLRFFSRLTLFELFRDTGYVVERMVARIVPEAMPEGARMAIELFARVLDRDVEENIRDAQPIQYVVRAQAV